MHATDGNACVRRMTQAMAHRGPDDAGIVRVGEPGEHELWLGHKRLAILDLSAAAHQPMHDPATGNWIAFNGEIYNHDDIRRELASDRPWNSHADTETILRAYARWGTACLHRMRGMFAFALYDATRQTLWCVRDRFGIKPFYFAKTRQGFVFASEVRAILRSGLFEALLDPVGLASYVRFGSVSEPHTMIAGVRSLPAATWMEVNASGIVRQEQYWDMVSAAEQATHERSTAQTVRQHLERSVREHLLSDVPVASFLSGGIDSTVITALAAQQSRQKLRTFTVGFTDSALDERRYAAEVAKRYGTEHHEVLLGDAQAMALVQSGIEAMDQPSADALNTYIVARAVARGGSKVVLSGLGGDELFGGYRSFRVLPLARRWAKLLPWLSHASVLARFAPGGERTLEMLRKHATLAMRYESLRSYWSRAELHAMHMKASSPQERDPHVKGLTARVSVLELDHYMRNVLLRDSDSMSMAHSLELRVPFLDHELAAHVLANGLAGRGRKSALIAACRDLLPAESIGRPKHGFVLPMRAWMLGALKQYQAEGLARFSSSGMLPRVPVKDLQTRFANGRLHWSRLWQFVVLGHWMTNVLRGDVAAAELVNRPSNSLAGVDA